MKSQPVKSAFGPIKPSAEALKAVVTKAQAVKQAESKESLPPQAPEPLPSAVELWLEVLTRTDRRTFGWAYIADRPDATKAIVVALNRHHWLAEQAVKGTEPRLLPLLCSLSLVEFLLSRQRRFAWVRATLAQLRVTLLTTEEQKIFSLQFLAETVASSPPFQQIAAQLTAPGAGEPSKRSPITTLNLEQAEPQP